MSAGSFAMPNTNQESRETVGPRVGQSANPFFLYPQSSMALSGAKRSAPMPTSSPTAPAPAPEGQYNAATQQAMSKAKIGEYTAAATSHLYTSLTPEQKKEFMPQTPAPTTIDRGGAGDTTYTPTGGEASLRMVTKDGKVHEDNSDNTEGMTRGNFSRQFENALKAGKGDEFAARYMPQGSDAGYQARYDKFGEGSGGGSSPMPMDPTRDPSERVRAAAATQNIRNQGLAATNKSKEAVAAANNTTKSTLADVKDRTTRDVTQWKLDNAERLASMNAQERAKAEADKTAEVKAYHTGLIGVQQQNADTNAQNAGTRATQAAQKGQVTPEDKYKAISDIYKNAKMNAEDKDAAVKALEEQWGKAAPSTQGANNPAISRDAVLHQEDRDRPPGRTDTVHRQGDEVTTGTQVGSLQTDNRWEKQDDGTYTHPGLPGSVYKDNGKSLVRVK